MSSLPVSPPLAPAAASSRPLRVLMISDVFFPRINGVSTSIETFRRDLGPEGIDVRLVAPAYGDTTPGDDPGLRRVPARRVVFDPEDRLMRWSCLVRTVDQVLSAGIDLIHIQTPFAAHYAGVRAARHYGLPVLATYHTHFEEYFHCYLPYAPRPALRAVARALARSQCNALDTVIVPSQAMAGRLADYGVRVPLHVLPTGIPTEQFRRGHRADFRQRHGIGENRPVALYVGRVAHEKNIDFLIEAAHLAVRRVPNLLLLIAGEGPALPHLQTLVTTLGLHENVSFVGYLDRSSELPDCYAAADLFVFASRTETQGLVLLEAMAAGLPVYALAEMGARDILAPERGAVIAADDVTEFAAGLAALITDRPRLARLAREAPLYAEEWSAPTMSRRLAHLYRSLQPGD